VVAKLPLKNSINKQKEVPFSVRPLILSPKWREPPQDLLRRCGIAAVNTKGMKSSSDRTIGQDNFSVSRLSNGWEVYCVMDGHGPDGHWPAMRAVRTLPFFLDQTTCTSMLKRGRVEAAIRLAFEKTQQDLEARAHVEKVKIFLSGCTVACCLRHPNESSVWLAHVGDSRSTLLTPSEGVLRETRDHNPRVESELQRVVDRGCEIDETTHDDGTTEVRIFVKDKCYPGIMMTRSMGDLCVKDHGVIAEPEVSQWSLDGRTDAMVLLASDGVWEFMSTQEVSQTVLGALEQGKTRQEAIKELVEKAKAAWETNEEEYCDDVTALLVPIGGPLLDPTNDGPPAMPCLGGVCKEGCSLQ